VVESTDIEHIGLRRVVPIETVVFVPFENQVAAHFFCAMFNSAICDYAVSSYSSQSTGSFGSPHILTSIAIPAFDKNNPLHVEIAKASRRAHAAACNRRSKDVAEAECTIDELATRAWGMSSADLKDIQVSLADIRATQDD
jgi:hypothetical protein